MSRRAHIVGVGETTCARWGKITDNPLPPEVPC